MAARKRSSSGRKKSTRKYGKTASKRVASTMHRRKKGTLKSGSGRKVKSRKQAIAIGLSEARAKGGKVPRKRSAKKSTRTKSSSRKKTGRKTTGRKKTGRKKSGRKSSSRS